jgi:hypothetical protein
MFVDPSENNACYLNEHNENKNLKSHCQPLILRWKRRMQCSNTMPANIEVSKK